MKNEIFSFNNITAIVSFLEVKETYATQSGKKSLKFVVTSSQKKADGTYATTYVRCETWDEKLFTCVKLLEKSERIKITGTFTMNTEGEDKKRFHTFPKVVVWKIEKVVPKSQIEGF